MARLTCKDVLNEALYKRLKSHFGVVKVTSPGQAMVASVSDDFITGNLRLNVEQPGEYYLVCCPYCNDTRFRLYVSHMYGQKDEAGRVMSYAAICYNEGCLQKEENRFHFDFAMNELPGVLAKAKIKKGVVLPAEARQKTMPGRCIPVDQLPPTHPANDYLISRNLDPITLGKFYGVSYCVESLYTLAIKRVIVPVYMHDRLVGWQGRYLADKPKEFWKKTGIPKYFTCPGMDRRFILGNFDIAKKFHTGILVEGWFDVFATGPMAMCMFGNTLTSHQHRDFVAAFGRRAGVYMIDPEEFGKPTTERAIRKLREAMSGNLVVVQLPQGTDPGKLPRDYLRRYIKAKAQEQAVEISWERIA